MKLKKHIKKNSTKYIYISFYWIILSALSASSTACFSSVVNKVGCTKDINIMYQDTSSIDLQVHYVLYVSLRQSLSFFELFDIRTDILTL